MLLHRNGKLFPLHLLRLTLKAEAAPSLSFPYLKPNPDAPQPFLTQLPTRDHLFCNIQSQRSALLEWRFGGLNELALAAPEEKDEEESNPDDDDGDDMGEELDGEVIDDSDDDTFDDLDIYDDDGNDEDDEDDE